LLRISRITAEDRPALRTMAEAYWEEIFPRSAVVHDPAYRERYFEGRFPHGADRASQWWAKAGEDIVGFANIELAQDDVGAAVGWIKDFYISPERRRQGHGAAFAGLLFRWFEEQGAWRVSLRARIESHSAVAFWRSVGCEPLHYEMRRYFEGR
jgi:GNAT superfamily N-acetyltransferase